MPREALRLTRDDLNDIAAAGGVAVVPTGSLEQHGPHLPVGTDTLLATAVSEAAVERATERGTEAVTFPAIWTGFSPHHLPFGGTVTVSKETLLALIDDVCDSLIGMGFSKVLLVNGHGGNRPAVSLAAGDLGTRQDEADVGSLSYITLGAGVADEIRRGDHGSAFHAGEFETSLLLHLYPDLVDEAAAADHVAEPLTPYSASDMYTGGPLSMRRTYDRITPHGVRGQATAASAETGAALFEAVVEELATLVESFAAIE